MSHSANKGHYRTVMRRKAEDRYLRWEDLRFEDMTSPSFIPSFLVKIKNRVFGKKVPARKQPVRALSPKAAARKEKLAFIAAQLNHHLHSTEFWLGIAFGIATRLATKMTILTMFEPSQKFTATAISVLACVAAGLLAGMAVHLVRTRYRNSRLVAGAPKEKYFTKAFVESAFIGLFGGIIGGGVANAGTMMMDAGTFILGASAGGTIGVAHAAVKGVKSQGYRKGLGWRMALQGIALGAVGGILGSVSYDIMGANAAVAAPIMQGNGVVFVPSGSAASFACGAECGNTVVPVQVEPIHQVPVAEPKAPPPEIVEKKAPAKVVHKHVRKPTACHTEKQVSRPKVVKHAVKPKIKIVEKIVEKKVYVPQPAPPPPPPPPVTMYQVIPGPCADEDCSAGMMGCGIVPMQAVPTQVVPSQGIPQGTPVHFAPAQAPVAPSTPAYMQAPAQPYAPAQAPYGTPTGAPMQLAPQQAPAGYPYGAQPYGTQPMQSVPIVPSQPASPYYQAPYYQQMSAINPEQANVIGPCKTADCVVAVNYDVDGKAINAVLQPEKPVNANFASAAKGTTTTAAVTDRPYYMQTSQAAQAPAEAKVAMVAAHSNEVAKTVVLPYDRAIGGPGTGIIGPVMMPA